MKNKSTYNPRIHHRRSIRLKGYDYSQQGLFFITVCVKNRTCLFGEIRNKKMLLNDAGVMVEKWYLELENKFPDIKCHEYIVMPNHFHCIVENVGADLCVCPQNGENVGADLCVCPQNGENVGADLCVCPQNGENVGVDLCVCPQNGENVGVDLCVCPDNEKGGHAGPPLQKESIFGEHSGSPLGQVLQWFKTMSTNEYIRKVKSDNWPGFDGKLWQRNYWEHIIRNDKSHFTISEYIINNPLNWDDDSINPQNEKDIAQK